MKKRYRWKIILVILVVGLAIFLAYPPGDKINLGLDLSGGMHLVFQVITDDAIDIETGHEITRLKDQFKKKNIEYETITKGKIGVFSIQNINHDQEGQIKDILDDYFKEWNYSIIGRTIGLSLRANVVQYLRDQSVNQARETITNRVDQFGVAEPVIQRQGLGGERIIVELPGVENPERVMNIIKTTALLEWKLVKGGPAPDRETLLRDYGGEAPQGMEILKGDPERTEGGYYLVSEVAEVTGNDLRSARRSVDEWNSPSVAFTLKTNAAKRFSKLTSENIGKPLSIVLDGKIQEVATIESRITDSGIIHGRFTQEQAEDLALVLRAGALPATIKLLENRTIGPSLGADSIRKGLSATIMALILVMLFMVFYYRLSGFNAIAALILNMILLLGALAYFKGTLTLPGIAGIILTIGMAVDANVLVFERIREELSFKKSILSAIATGFSRAFRTILDANVTTIIAAVFLFQFGTGPVKGFAVTLIIGITASMFTAVFVSRLIFELVLSKRRRREKLSI
ncbi:MAG: protein translocase subunit SecD [Candidatus Aminicenantaceae bacterium]